MRKITFITLLVALVTLSANSFAGNWVYNTTTAKWVKNITPEMLQFNNLTTTAVQSSIYVSAGFSNPGPGITTTTGQDLTNGFFAVTGGQITGTTNATLVKQGFVISSEPDVTGTAGILRIAGNTSTVTDGKLGVTGYVNLNWYIPTKYNRSGYTFVFSDSIYTAASWSLTLNMYNEAGTTNLAGSDYSVATVSNATGWKALTLTQIPSYTPFRIKLSLGALAANNAYIKTPRFELTSTTEPTTRTVTVTTNADGTVTPTYGNLHDQDVEVFNIAPVTGKTVDLVTYNAAAVTPTVSGVTFTYTTPLLTADGALVVTYKADGPTGLSTEKQSTVKLSSNNGVLSMAGLTVGEKIKVYSVNGTLVQQFIANQSNCSVKLPRGMYLVTIANKANKIVL